MALQSTSSNSRRFWILASITVIILAVVAVLLIVLPGGSVSRVFRFVSGSSSSDLPPLSKIHRQLLVTQTELQLAAGDSTYLVLDFSRQRLALKLKGAILWDTPMQLDPDDSSKVAAFIDNFSSDCKCLVQPIERIHLFEATTLVSDSILAIVSKAVSVPVDRLRRMIPERFRVHWSDRLALDITSDIQGEAISAFDNYVEEIRRAVNLPFGETTLTVRVDSEKAMTLFGACKQGMMTLIVPKP